jgi:RNA recognition motif-containing protein
MEKYRYSQNPSQEAKPSKQLPYRVFVGGLPKKSTNDSLMKFFLQFGRLTECKIIQDPVTLMNKNFAFVAFQLKEDYDNFLALDMVKHKYMNAVLTIKPSQGKDQVEATKKDEANRKVSLFNIPHQTKVEDLRKKLQIYFGEIEQIDQHFYKGYAFVLFKNRESAQSLIQSGTFKFNSMIIEARQFLRKDEVNNQKQAQPQVQVSAREPSNTQNTWGQQEIRHQQYYRGEQYIYNEPASQNLNFGAQNNLLFGFSGVVPIPPQPANVGELTEEERDSEIPQTRDRTRTDLSSLLTNHSAREFKEMGIVESSLKPEAVSKSVLGSQAASDKRKEKSAAGSKNESAQSRIRADQEKTLSYLLDEEDDTKREISDSVKQDEMSSTTVSKLTSNFDSQAVNYQYQPIAHESGKLFSMFVHKSPDMQTELDKLLFKSEILGDTKQPDNIKTASKKHFGGFD